jgi:hypothetical protein
MVEQLTEEDGRNIDTFRALEKSVKDISPALMRDVADLASKYPDVFELSLTTLVSSVCDQFRPATAAEFVEKLNSYIRQRNSSTGTGLVRALHFGHVRACHLQTDLGRGVLFAVSYTRAVNQQLGSAACNAAQNDGAPLPNASKRSSARSSGMTVELACLGNVLFLLRGHLRGIRTARNTTRPEFPTSNLVLGQPFFVAGIAGHPSPSS